MENITFYDSETIQLDALGMDSSLHLSADGHFFRKDVALNWCTIADQNARGVELALDTSGNSHSPLAGNLADNCDTGADRGNLVRGFRSLRDRDYRALKRLHRGMNSIVFFRVILGLSKHVLLLMLAC